MTKTGIGIIGCGSISTTYLTLAPLFAGLEIRAVADIEESAAEARAAEFGVRADTVEALLAADDIDIVVNLTPPAAHFEVTRRILQAGKHAYSEKPYVLSLDDGEELRVLAAKTGRRVGSAPDTFLGGAHQRARMAIDHGKIGYILSGTCHVMSHGMEAWHPNPDFFFEPGGGPVLDLGPYYITNLVHLIGPVRAVTAMSGAGFPTRTIASGVRTGEVIPVTTPTTIHAILEFENGALITLGASWDVWSHRHGNIELYGSDGSLFVPDPNFFGGEVSFAGTDGAPHALTDDGHPFSANNMEDSRGRAQANYRCAGLADMAAAIAEDRPHRCSQTLATHVVDIMTAILKSGETRQWVELSTTCERPEPIGPAQAQELLA